MAIIKPRRGTGYPSGLTLGELAVDTTNRVVYIGSAGGTGITIGSHITNYVVSFNGSTGAVQGVSSVAAGSGVGVSPSGGTGNVTITNTGVTGITSGTATAVSGITGFVSVSVSHNSAGLASKSSVSKDDRVLIGDDGSVSPQYATKYTTVGGILDFISGDITVDSSGVAAISPGVIVDADVSGGADIAVTKLRAFTISGHTLGNTLSTLTIGNGLGGGSYNGSAPVTITNTGVTQAIAGAAISLSAQTGTVTITNTGVTQAVAGNGISVSGATGTVTITNQGVTGILNGTGPGGNTWGIRITSATGTGSMYIINTGVTQAVAGNGISVSGATGTVTIANTGVLSAVTGTNITISPASGTGNVTIGVVNNPTFTGLVTAQSLSVTGDAHIGGNLGVTGTATIQGAIAGNSSLTIASTGLIGGNFTVNGTNTTINSTNVRIADPVPTIGWTSDAAPLCSNNDNKDRGFNFWWTTGCTGTAFATEVVAWGERAFNGTGLFAIVQGITEFYTGPKQGYFGYNRAYKTFIALDDANINGTGAGGSGAGGAERFSGALSPAWFDYILLGTGASGTNDDPFNYTNEPRCILRPPPASGRSFSIYTLPPTGGTLAHWNDPGTIADPTTPALGRVLQVTAVVTNPAGGGSQNNPLYKFGWVGTGLVESLVGPSGNTKPNQNDMFVYSGGSYGNWKSTATHLADNYTVFQPKDSARFAVTRPTSDKIEFEPVLGKIESGNKGLIDGATAFTYIRDNTVASINGLTGAVTNLCATRVDATGTNANAQFYPLFAAGTGCTLVSLDPDATHFRYNPSTGVLTALGITAGGSTFTGNVNISGTLSATAKSFLIPHPTRESGTLRYGSLEGPENAVYVRGRTKEKTIYLPEYWSALVHHDSITVNLTPIGRNNTHWVKDIKPDRITIECRGKTADCFFIVYGERKDIPKLVVED